jgi:MFS family permease
MTDGRPRPQDPNYKWVALSNTTLGALMSSIDGSIVVISLPAIFNGIHLNPLAPGNIGYLLWTLTGYQLVTAALVVAFGRLGDLHGRVRMYNAGFAIFTVGSLLIAATPFTGSEGAQWIIATRLIQGIGGACLFANSAAIITDAFPSTQRGLALGINGVAVIAGQFIGLLAGGLLAVINWRLVFFVSVPIGLTGTLWAYLRLQELGTITHASVDWRGNLTFAAGLTAILIGVTYGIQPYGSATMGWTNPFVVALLLGGGGLLALFLWLETRVEQPLVDLSLFRIRAFAAGTAALLLSSIARGGLSFVLVIWLQGIWLPLHGYAYADTPLWAGIYMLPLTAGFLVAGPLSGFLSDRYGARPFATGGMLLVTAVFLALMRLPVLFTYPAFALLLGAMGIGNGLFNSPNNAAIMNSVPSKERGAAAGVRSMCLQAGNVLSNGVFFTLMIGGLAGSLPAVLERGLLGRDVPAAIAATVAQLPPVSSLFAALLGYNPLATVLPAKALNALPESVATDLVGKGFFPQLLSGPFGQSLVIVFGAAATMTLVAAAASWLRGGRYVYVDPAGREQTASRPVSA